LDAALAQTPSNFGLKRIFWQANLILASRQGFGELKTEQLGGHSQEQQRHRQALIDEHPAPKCCKNHVMCNDGNSVFQAQKQYPYSKIFESGANGDG